MADKKRKAEINLDPEQFRQLGHDLIDQLADFLKSLPNRPVTPGESPSTVRSVLGQGDVPTEGTEVASLIKNVTLKIGSQTIQSISDFQNYTAYKFSFIYSMK